MKKVGFSEYVSLGHPDKIADYISEVILDQYVLQDPTTRFALEVQIKDNFVTLGGEITSKVSFTKAQIEGFVRDAVCQIGYTLEYQKRWGKENTLSCDDLIVEQHISEQSPDIAQGVDAFGWGDQGIMFGLAVNNPKTNYLPLDIFMARKIGKHLFDLKYAGLDIKTQVTVEDDAIRKIIVAIPMLEHHSVNDIRNVCQFCCDGSTDYDLIVNGTGRFVRHASMGDCGTTGRKLAVDFYGGNCNVGGGSPWTKDGSKADLTLNLYARYKAVEYVKRTNEPYCKCGIACCIGKSQIEVFLMNEKNEIIEAYNEDKTPEDLIRQFNLRTPVFANMCREGLFYV